MSKRFFYGHVIVTAGFLTQAVTIGAMFTYGVFFKELQAAFGWSRSLVSGASALAFLLMGIGAVGFGTLNDKVGPRLIMTISGISLGVGYILMAWMETPWQLILLYGGLVGVGFSTHDVITLTTVARWFEKRRGAMSGIVKVGTGAGQFLVPLVAAGTISVLGWRRAYLWLGITTLVALVLLAQLMRRDPQQMGLLPDGPASGHLKDRPAPPAPAMDKRAALRSRPFWILCLAEFASFFCLLTTIVHIVPHARDQGMSPTTAAAVLSTIGAASMLGRFVMGITNDRIGGKRSLALSFIILIGSLVWLQFALSPWMLYLFAVVYGFAHGALFTVMSPAVAEWFGTASHGQLFGTVLFFGTLGGSVGPLLTGYIFDVSGSYRLAFMVLTALAISGLVLILLLPPSHGPTAAGGLETTGSSLERI